MKSHHTPGPWTYQQVPSSLPKNNHFEVIANSPHMSGMRQTICDINGPHAHLNYEHNARLIASSPSLLAALNDIVCCAHTPGPHGTTMYFISDERMNAAKSAINKATGK